MDDGDSPIRTSRPRRSPACAWPARSRAPGPPLVLLHGLTATRRYVLQGSRMLARRGGRQLVSYDARGHGASAPAPAADGLRLSGPGGATSRRCWTRAAWSGWRSRAARWARPRPWPSRLRIPAASRPWCRSRLPTTVRPQDDPRRLGRTGGGPGARRHRCLRPAVGRRARARAAFASRPCWPPASAWSATTTPPRWPTPCARSPAPRLSTGWSGWPRSRSRCWWWAAGTTPTRAIPLAVAEEYARRLPRATLVVEGEGESPLAWRGAALSRAIAGFLDQL